VSSQTIPRGAQGNAPQDGPGRGVDRHHRAAAPQRDVNVSFCVFGRASGVHPRSAAPLPSERAGPRRQGAGGPRTTQGRGRRPKQRPCARRVSPAASRPREVARVGALRGTAVWVRAVNVGGLGLSGGSGSQATVHRARSAPRERGCWRSHGRNPPPQDLGEKTGRLVRHSAGAFMACFGPATGQEPRGSRWPGCTGDKVTRPSRRAGHPVVARIRTTGVRIRIPEVAFAFRDSHSGSGDLHLPLRSSHSRSRHSHSRVRAFAFASPRVASPPTGIRTYPSRQRRGGSTYRAARELTSSQKSTF
jgi:hypothetical protein